MAHIDKYIITIIITIIAIITIIITIIIIIKIKIKIIGLRACLSHPSFFERGVFFLSARIFELEIEGHHSGAMLGISEDLGPGHPWWFVNLPPVGGVFPCLPVKTIELRLFRTYLINQLTNQTIFNQPNVCFL